jgi:hypothetical protein
MKIIFKDIPEGFFKAEVTEIREENGEYGPYLRIIFTIIQEGELAYYRFSGFVKPTPLRQSKFYRWIKNILGKEPDDKFSTQDIIGKECMVHLSKQDKYYSVTDIAINPN